MDGDQGTRPSLEERLRDIEITLWGVDRTNGMRSQIRAMQKAVNSLPAMIDTKVDGLAAKIDERDEGARRERKAYIRWAITMSVTIIAALIGAMAVILTAGGHG
jgi:hypothetical protein